MGYISAHELANKWGISKRRVQTLCASGRISNAMRIGNMWVVPDTASRPLDARMKKNDKPFEHIGSNPIKLARTRIRSLSDNAFKTLINGGFTAFDAKIGVIALFAVELLSDKCAENDAQVVAIQNRIIDTVSNLIECNIMRLHKAYSEISSGFRIYIKEHPFCIDDALAWCYQYVNKASGDTGFEAAQFFTEKYIITTLIDSSDICRTDGKILDPACGGGNFLLYALDNLCEQHVKPNDTKQSIKSLVQTCINRLFGYEIDPTLALVASINLRLKAMSILKNNGITVTITDFMCIEPNIYKSLTDSKWGALDNDKDHHIVEKVGCLTKTTLSDVLSDTQYIFTNPPFQTVKGMDQDQKDFLKQFYPLAKCDMCNAFIELCSQITRPTGRCGLVTQNSWLYLDSFKEFRKDFLTKCSIESIIELGTNAFYDISGEKTNVVLLSFEQNMPTTNTDVSMFSLKNLKQREFEHLLSTRGNMCQYQSNISQLEILHSPTARVDMLNSTSLKTILKKNVQYGAFATPMQGTSTGNAKELIGYFWEHLGDSDWIPVSKGGGYSRWQGLNNYCVKWGTNGEYIMATKGSAIRNAKHFCNTQLVFSDTGTAGLNVRVLREGQIFVASGPGIRITSGDPYAHLSFLNSRFATYFIRLLSPKLTIAAGYIAQIPVKEELLFSNILSDNAKKCLAAKQQRLEKRPCNMEFKPIASDALQLSVDERARLWFIQDIEDEWIQLCAEQAIDDVIYKAFSLSSYDKNIIDTQIGERKVYSENPDKFCSDNIEKVLPELLDINCTLVRTRTNKSSMGCDGVLEYVAQKTNTSCESIYNSIVLAKTNFPQIQAKYKSLYLHALTLSAVGYQSSIPTRLPVSVKQIAETIKSDYPGLIGDISEIVTWLKNEFNKFHRDAFWGVPLFHYNSSTDSIDLQKGHNV
jgi:hypothetical protein